MTFKLFVFEYWFKFIADNSFKNTTNLKYRKSCYLEVDTFKQKHYPQKVPD